MSEIWKIFLTSSITIIGGVLIYVSGQIISKFFIDPIHEQKKVIGEIADALIFYANMYSNPGLGKREKMDEASERLRQLATLLQSRTHLIPWYKIFSTIKIVGILSDIEQASSELIGLSNSIYGPPGQDPGILSSLSDQNIKAANNIKKLLSLKIK